MRLADEAVQQVVELAARGRRWCRRGPGPGWTTVLRGAFTKPKRVPIGARPAAPADSSPRQTASTARSAEQTASTSTSGLERREPVAVDVAARLEELGLLAVERPRRR